jgi:hypothetical protein
MLQIFVILREDSAEMENYHELTLSSDALLMRIILMKNGEKLL